MSQKTIKKCGMSFCYKNVKKHKYKCVYLHHEKRNNK